ncbi:MAG: Ca-activated chloride channel [Acidimicrobiaceae bacterium]
MGLQGKLPAAQTDTCTFINIMQQSDNLAVVAFNDNASRIFPTATAPPLAGITGQATKDAGCAAVLALAAGGNTNITAALVMAQQLLGSAAVPRGIVLLSDGMWNVGGDPTHGLNTSVPVYTVALGQSFNPGFLQAIATQTGGTYNYAPDAFTLADIYNDIASEAHVAALVAQQQRTVSQYNFVTTPVPVAAGNDAGCFTCNWLNTAVAYTPGTPVGSQLTVRLVDPSNQPWAGAPAGTGPGFVAFQVPNPAAGQWQVELWTSAPGGVQATLAGFEPDSSTWLDLAVDSARGTYRSALIADGRPVTDARVSAVVHRPLRSLEESLRMHKSDLERIEPDESAVADGVPEELARLAALRASLSVGAEDPHPYVFEPLPPPTFDGEAHTGVIDVPHDGEYTVHVVAYGGGARRQRRGSFVAS